MQKIIRLLFTGAACLTLIGLFTGCSSVTRRTPTAGTIINANMTSSDYEVLGTTEGSSQKTSILCGLVQIIDGDKVAVLGVKFFEDQYAYMDKGWHVSINAEDRAYYKALAATPDADSVVNKAYIKTRSGIPIIYSSQNVTFQGKALKYKSHN